MVKLKQTYTRTLLGVQWTGFNITEICRFTGESAAIVSNSLHRRELLRIGILGIDLHIGDWILKQEGGGFIFCSADNCVKHYYHDDGDVIPTIGGGDLA